MRGDAARRILKAARSLRSDLIVLASHGRAGAGAFWQGSVGSPVCAASSVPVLLVPAAPENAGPPSIAFAHRGGRALQVPHAILVRRFDRGLRPCRESLLM